MAKAAAEKNTVKTNGAVTSGELDLDALLAERRLEPVPVKLGGHTYRVRRDLRTAEINAFWEQLRRGADGDVPAFEILLGDAEDARRFVEFHRELPREHEQLVLRKVVIAAGLQTEADFEAGTPGESAAS